jgi:hypothetical protein
MIAFTIALTWLTLTAGGFAALMALGRVEPRSDAEPDPASHERDMFVSAEALLGLRPVAGSVRGTR